MQSENFLQQTFCFTLPLSFTRIVPQILFTEHVHYQAIPLSFTHSSLPFTKNVNKCLASRLLPSITTKNEREWRLKRKKSIDFPWISFNYHRSLVIFWCARNKVSSATSSLLLQKNNKHSKLPAKRTKKQKRKQVVKCQKLIGNSIKCRSKSEFGVKK